ncbi:unnamed protein product [Oncorhynchus mykiss]|uniref:CWH43-like N-terminal domain-containing protein n=1 Tax=Oncorhynchus mykiss TaxID=8022 RepID=A0A060W9I6_ONCMY|nr:unnamed protein product [Oncorhynchus mykiss]
MAGMLPGWWKVHRQTGTTSICWIYLNDLVCYDEASGLWVTDSAVVESRGRNLQSARKTDCVWTQVVTTVLLLLLSLNYQDMVLWSLLPISLSLVSLIGTWVTYGLAYSYDHVCSLNNWAPGNPCGNNTTMACCQVPTISTSGTSSPENSMFTATINAASFLFMVFCIFHHAHILERNSVHSMLSRIALVFGGVAAVGAFVAGNCNPEYLTLAHYLGAAVSFLCICFYSLLLTVLTGKCVLTRMEWFLYPARVMSTAVQIIVTIGYAILFVQEEYVYKHSAAVFEWILSVNLELFELSFAVEFCFFSSSMLCTLLGKKDEEKPILLA